MILRPFRQAQRASPQTYRDSAGVRHRSGQSPPICTGLYAESLARGYCFDAAKISRARYSGLLRVTRGQLDYEWKHLLAKLVMRDLDRHRQLRKIKRPRPHPLFRIIAGSREDWEKGWPLQVR